MPKRTCRCATDITVESAASFRVLILFSGTAYTREFYSLLGYADLQCTAVCSAFAGGVELT